MSSAPNGEDVMDEYEGMIRPLIAERFTRWSPTTTAEDRDEMVTCPTVRDGLPFETITRSVRARKFRLNTDASRRNS